MSRGLYQLSYGSNRRNMPPFPPFGKKKKTFRREFPDRRSVGSPSPGPAPFLSCPSSGIATKKALSPEGKRAWLPARPEGIRRSPTFAGQRRGHDARQETTVFLREQPLFRGQEECPFAADPEGGEDADSQIFRRVVPCTRFNAYRAWKYSRGCAQAGQVSGASRPSCT